MKKVLYIPSKFKGSEDFVTLSSRGVLFFSVPFVKKNSLLSSTSADLFTFVDDPYKFAVKFYSSEDQGHLKVNPAQKSKNLLINAHEFVNSIFVLKKSLKEGKQTFPIVYDKLEKCFVFSLLPSFEYSCAPNKVPAGLKGIYRYKNDKQEVIYIGKGCIKERLKEGSRKAWPIDLVEYSVIEDEEVRSSSEAHHIRKFETEIGRKPIFNMISGKKTPLDKESSESTFV